LQVFSDQTPEDFPEFEDVSEAFYPKESEGTTLNLIYSDANKIALDRISQVQIIKETGEEISTS
jgi:hypothetical protein